MAPYCERIEVAGSIRRQCRMDGVCGAANRAKAEALERADLLLGVACLAIEQQGAELRLLRAAVAAERESLAKQCDERAAEYRRKSKESPREEELWWRAKKYEAEDIAALIRGGKA